MDSGHHLERILADARGEIDGWEDGLDEFLPHAAWGGDGRSGVLLFSPPDAIAVVDAAERLGVPAYGLDSFLILPQAIEPVQEYELDTQAATTPAFVSTYPGSSELHSSSRSPSSAGLGAVDV